MYISIANSVGSSSSLGSGGLAAPVATAATGVGQTSFTANWNAYTGAVVYLLDVSESSDFSTFVYENQQVNAPTTSYVVIGLEPNTTYYYRVRASTESLTDPDAQAFFTRVTDAGGTLSTTEQDAVNTLVEQMKADGIWTKMKAIYPMVGASAAACAQNLKSSSFTGTFTATGWTFSSSGIKPDGTAYMDTNFNPLIELSDKNSVHYSNYFPNLVSNGRIQIGSTDAFGGYYAAWNDIVYQGVHRLSDNDNTFLNNGSGQSGYNIGTRTASNLSTLYINKYTTFTSSSISDALPNANVYIGARNAAGINAPSFDEQSFVTMGDGLTATDADNLYDVVQAFQTTLSRNVGPQVVSDADAQAYINRVYNAGGTLTNTEANAVNQLTIDMKAAGIWNAMKAVYPMVGASALACAQNLKSSSFTGTFTAGWTFASTGATPNGTSAYMDTGFNPTLHLTNQIESHLSLYSRTQKADVSRIDIGSYQVNSGHPYCASMYYLGEANKFAGHKGGYPTNFTRINNNDTTGFLFSTRRTNSELNLFQDGIKLVSNTTTLTTELYPNLNSWVGGYNRAPGSSDQFSFLEVAFASFGDGLTDTEASDFYTLVQAFQTTLNREITP